MATPAFGTSRAVTALLGFVFALGACDGADPTALAPTDMADDSTRETSDETHEADTEGAGPVACQEALAECLSTCSGGFCGAEDQSGDPLQPYGECVESCYEQFRSCTGGWKPSSCEQEIDDCLNECSPYYPREPNSAWPDECIAACYAKQDECAGAAKAACMSDLDCAPEEMCAWFEQDCEAGDCFGICVPSASQGSCDETLAQCLLRCDEGLNCEDDAGFGEAQECTNQCYADYDQCLGQAVYVECSSDLDCPQGSFCAFSQQDCDPSTGECGPGVCAPWSQDATCDTTLSECLGVCASTYDCSEGVEDCLPRNEEDNQASCESQCWLNYDSCLYPEASECELAYEECAYGCPTLCDENGCSLDPACLSDCEVAYGQCVDAQ